MCLIPALFQIIFFPQFIVLYNGTTAFPEQSTLRLSDAFEKVAGFEDIFLELVVKVYNINEGNNTEIANRSEELRGYAYFVSRVRYHEDMERERDWTLDKADITRAAIRMAIKDCRDKSLLVDYWDNLSKEEITMLGSEWDMGIALEVEREEGFEKGRENEREKIARNALAKGLPIEVIHDITGLDIEAIRNLQAGEQ